jgi:hypothetical protein
MNSLDNCNNVDKNGLAEIQRKFITANASRFMTRTTCTNFQDLVQRQGENIQDCYLRVTESFRRMCDAKPSTIKDIRANELNGMADNDNTRAKLAAVKREGLVDMERFFLHQIFIARMRDELRSKVREAGKASLQESLSLARALMVNINEWK